MKRKKIRKRKAVTIRDEKLFLFIEEQYNKKKSFEDTDFFSWLDKQITKYNKTVRKKFELTIKHAYLNWKANKDRR